MSKDLGRERNNRKRKIVIDEDNKDKKRQKTVDVNIGSSKKLGLLSPRKNVKGDSKKQQQIQSNYSNEIEKKKKVVVTTQTKQKSTPSFITSSPLKITRKTTIATSAKTKRTLFQKPSNEKENEEPSKGEKKTKQSNHSNSKVSEKDSEEEISEKEESEDLRSSSNSIMDMLFSPVLKFLNSNSPSSSQELPTTTTTTTKKPHSNVSLRSSETIEVLSIPEREEKDDLSASQESPSEYVQQRSEEIGASSLEDSEEEFDPYLFIKGLPPNPPPPHTFDTVLPQKNDDDNRMTLVLDLDETLVHCSLEDEEDDADLVIKVPFGGVEYKVCVFKRPGFIEFLRQVSKIFEVVVFTASQQVYADRLLDILDPKRELIHHRLFRDSCIVVQGNYLKDLRVLGRDLKKVVIVDNSPHVFGFQLDNGIPIETWFNDQNDNELLNLVPFLHELKEAEDVRPLVRNKFKLYERVYGSPTN